MFGSDSESVDEISDRALTTNCLFSTFQAMRASAEYGTLGMACKGDLKKAQPKGLSFRHGRVLLAIGGTLCLIGAHCLIGFMVYQTSLLGVPKSSYLRALHSGPIADIEASLVKKSILRDPIVNKRSITLDNSLPPSTVRRDLLNSWWQNLKPSTSGLERDGEAFLSAYDSVEHAKVDALFGSYCLCITDLQLQQELSSVNVVVSSARKHSGLKGIGAKRTMLLETGVGNGIDALGLNVPNLRHFATAAANSDFYVSKYKYGRKHPARKQQLLDPQTYPAVDFPWAQNSLDSGVSNGPAKTFDTAEGVTCPKWIPNCRPQHNTLKSCHFSCGAYCQSIRGNGPCESGESDGSGPECKFGYRGAKYTPDVSLRDESGWLEGKEHWAEGGPDDCLTCPVGFKVKPEYGDGTGRCVPCSDGWLDPETGQITEAGCAGGQYVQLVAGKGGEPGQLAASEDFEDVPGCMPTSDLPQVGAKVLIKIPDDLKKSSKFFEGYTEDWYPGVVFGWDKEADKLAVQFNDGGPMVEYDPGVPAKLGSDVIPLPDVGDKVTLSAGYWAACCSEEYDPDKAGPLVLGSVGEVLAAAGVGSGDGTYTVLAPNGEQWIYSTGEILKLVGEVKCPLPGEVTLNTVGQVPNNLMELDQAPKGAAAQPADWSKKVPVDPDCCCCARDLWVGCWGWCGDGTAPKSLHQHSDKGFRAGYGTREAPQDWSSPSS